MVHRPHLAGSKLVGDKGMLNVSHLKCLCSNKWPHTLWCANIIVVWHIFLALHCSNQFECVQYTHESQMYSSCHTSHKSINKCNKMEE